MTGLPEVPRVPTIISINDTANKVPFTVSIEGSHTLRTSNHFVDSHAGWPILVEPDAQGDMQFRVAPAHDGKSIHGEDNDNETSSSL